MRQSWITFTLFFTAAAFLVVSSSSLLVLGGEEAADPPHITIGERLFLETRFAQFFKAFLDGGRDVNDPLPAGDPVMDATLTIGRPLPGPFAGQSMNCRACHLVDEHIGIRGGGMRSYADFARRSPFPAREDAKMTAPRNSPPLVNASLARTGGTLFHFDAEFATLMDLGKSTVSGRNYGWLPLEAQAAIAHVARVIREDNGQGGLAQQFGGLSYALVLTGTDHSIPEEFRLPRQFRVEVAGATDAELFDAVAKLIAAYTESLVFSQDDDGNFNLSPYDVFLEKNGLPRKPRDGETALAYSRRLLKLVERLEDHGRLEFVTANPNADDGKFQFHDQVFKFGPKMLKGLKIFFSEPGRRPLRPSDLVRGQTGNCIACHAAPNFTDFRLHNTGTAQAEFDRIHGRGAFVRLEIPGLQERNTHHNMYLPATAQHPNAAEPFRAVPSVSAPTHTDLGLWNIFANPDFPEPQTRLRHFLCEERLQAILPGLERIERFVSALVADEDDRSSDGRFLRPCRPDVLLPRTIARFKTPGLRDLGHSAPYMHTGQFDTIEDIISFYRVVSDLARSGDLRNGARDLLGVALTEEDIAPLVAFLKALNEDYE